MRGVCGIKWSDLTKIETIKPKEIPMSYSIQSPCYNCEKKDACTDLKAINDGVQNDIHTKSFEQGHQGSGTIVLMCIRQKSAS
jgi:hypothetical protein